MGAKKVNKDTPDHSKMMLVDFDGLKKLFPITWCDKTLERRIESGFPAMRDGHDLLFNPQEVMDYFKKRRAKR